MPCALMDLQAWRLLFDRITIAISGVHTEKLPFAVFGTQAEITGLLRTTGNTGIDLADRSIETGAPRVVVVIARNGEKRRPFLRLHIRDNIVQHIEHVRGALLDGAGIVDVAEVDDDVGIEFLQRLMEQRRIIGHMGSPIANHQDAAVLWQSIVDDAEIDVRRSMGLPVVVGRRQMRKHVVLRVIPAALDPACDIPAAIFRDKILERREQGTVSGRVVILMRLKSVKRGLGSLSNVAGRSYRRLASTLWRCR